ncbi:MAG TPA: hypothetical protein VHC69_06815 [Polyangiaceae bacterium]|nr:hypothetical protein [Polyangiaceae bacterium]
MTSIEFNPILENLTEARREILMAWSPDDGDDNETPRHLMTALMDLEIAIIALERYRELAPPPTKASAEGTVVQ